MNFQTGTTILNMFCEELLGIPAEPLRIYAQVAKPVNERGWLGVFCVWFGGGFFVVVCCFVFF